MMTAIQLKSASGWIEELGYALDILSPNGWTNDGTPLSVPITKCDFMRRLGVSTCRFSLDTVERITAYWQGLAS